MKNKAFWIDTGIRAVRTVAQALVGAIGTAAVLSDVNWPAALSTAALAGIVSVLMSLDRLGTGTGGETDSDTRGKAS